MRIYNKRSTKAWSFACEILPDDSNIRRLLLQLDEKQEIQGRPNNFVGLGRQGGVSPFAAYCRMADEVVALLHEDTVGYFPERPVVGSEEHTSADHGP